MLRGGGLVQEADARAAYAITAFAAGVGNLAVVQDVSESIAADLTIALGRLEASSKWIQGSPKRWP